MTRAERFAAGLDALIADAAARVAALTDEQRNTLEQQMALSPSDAVAILNLNASAFAMDQIPLAVSQRVYNALSPIGWRADSTLAERIMVLNLAQVLIAKR
jgi:hypothetical protein